MARTPRETKLETRAARLKLPAGQYHWKLIDVGLGLGYRRGRSLEAVSTWTVRMHLQTVPILKHATAQLGLTDDFADADERHLTYFQAVEAARRWALAYRQQTHPPTAPYTVADAMRDYLAWYAAHRKALADTRGIVEAHILPALGGRLCAELSAAEIRRWHEGLAERPARLRSRPGAEQKHRESEPRARKSTANRILTVLKAALTHAFRDGKIPDDLPWRRVAPFRGVESARVRFLSQDEITRLLNACPPDFRDLVALALVSGARYGELIRLTVADFHAESGTLHVRESKSGQPRHIPLTAEGQALVGRLVLGRRPDDRLLIRADGRPWGTQLQQRPLAAAAQIAGIPELSFHILRHTYASRLAMAGVPIATIAAALGHADTRVTSRHYAHLSPGHVADSIRAGLPDLGLETDPKVIGFHPRR